MKCAPDQQCYPDALNRQLEIIGISCGQVDVLIEMPADKVAMALAPKRASILALPLSQALARIKGLPDWCRSRKLIGGMAPLDWVFFIGLERQPFLTRIGQ